VKKNWTAECELEVTSRNFFLQSSLSSGKAQTWEMRLMRHFWENILPLFSNIYILSNNIVQKINEQQVSCCEWLFRVFYYRSDLIFWELRTLATCNIIKTFEISTHDTIIPHSKQNKNRLKRISQTVFHIKKDRRRYKYTFYLVINTLIPPKSLLKLKSSKCYVFVWQHIWIV
jgi:hypothetical protein